jgi:hypothetical protein
MARPFLETFGQMRSGRLMEECAQALADIVKGVRETRKAGSFKITITVKPPKGNSVNYLLVADLVEVKVPKLDQGDTVFFCAADGSLTRNDPSQMDLALRSVPQPDREIATNINPQTGEVTEVIGRP